ncbi:hypothetical protein D3C84_371230 [compost metagenome]
MVSGSEHFTFVRAHLVEDFRRQRSTQHVHVFSRGADLPVEVASLLLRDHFFVIRDAEFAFTDQELDEDLFTLVIRFFARNAKALELIPLFVKVQRLVQDDNDVAPDNDVFVLFHDGLPLVRYSQR